MFEPISGLFSEEERQKIGVGDVHHLVQRFLREEKIGEGAYCQPIAGGTLMIRVSTPTIAQEIRLLEHDIRQLVQSEAGVPIKKIQIAS